MFKLFVPCDSPLLGSYIPEPCTLSNVVVPTLFSIPIPKGPGTQTVDDSGPNGFVYRHFEPNCLLFKYLDAYGKERERERPRAGDPCSRSAACTV